MKIKYLKLIKKNNGVEISGDVSAFFGYEYSSNDGGIPGGVWAKWKWDDDTLVIENDRFGYYHLFYYCDEKKVIVSNSIAEVVRLGGRDEYDEIALSFFCRSGFFLNEQTAFKYIKVLPPNGKVKWRNGKVSVSGGPSVTKLQKMTTEQMVDGYIENFRQAVGRVLPDDDSFAMPLSGGRDSRQILFELMRYGYKPRECVTCGESRDVKVTNIIAERLGLNHKVLTSNQRWVKDTIVKNEVTQFSAIEHSWLMCLGEYLESNFNVSYDGTGIGIFSRSADFLNDEALGFYADGKYEQLSQSMFRNIYSGLGSFELLPEEFRFLANREDDAVEFCIEEIKRFDEAANPLASFNFYNAGRRSIAMSPFGIQSGLKVFAPFLDYDLYDFVSSLDPAMVLENEPQSLAIKKAFSKYADIPFYDEIEKVDAGSVFIGTKIFNKADLMMNLGSFGISLVKANFKLKGVNGKRNTRRFTNILLYLSQLDRIKKRPSI